jgi:hypothetical protein
MDLAQFWNNSGGYQISQSLRFNSADSAYLNRTPGSAGNRKTWTWSGWVKRGTLGTTQAIWGNYFGANDNSQFRVYFNSDNTIYVGFYSFTATVSNAVFRDASAWYHITVSFDSTQSTASNRLKVYVNGTELSWATDNRSSITLNGDFAINAAQAHYIGYDNVANYFNGYLAEINFIDGSALTPSSFGETDTITGAWIPKKYSGSFGTNGFYLKFESSGIGTDSSGNGNTWTASGFSTSGTGTDVMSDTPTNNWCTLNPLNTYNNNTSNGNLTYSQTNSNNAVSQGTIGMPSGKWYWEINAANVGNGVYGITRYEYPTQAVFGCSNGYGTGFSPALNEAYINSSTASSSYCSSPSAPSSGTYMFAFDADARKFWMGVNGTWYTKTGGSAGDPGAGTNELFGTSDITAGVVYRALIGGSAVTTVSGDINFGQRSFSYTPPTGYKALNTANLPEPTIKDGGKYFNTVTYAGNTPTGQSITGVGFQPDWLWIKARSYAGSHALMDVLRGSNKQLVSNSTNAEGTNSSGKGVLSFDSDGFTLGEESDALGSTNGSQTYVAWNWKAGGTGSSNNAGTITSTVSANASAGFSIVTYTGTGSNASVGHGLGVTPSMCIIKQRNTAQSWWVWHQALGNNVGANNTMLELNGTAGTYAADDVFRGFTSTVFNIGTDSGSNTNGGTYVAYCFSEVAGYSKFGSYTGNGSSDGPAIWCGFRPAWLLIKRTDSSSDWILQDSKRLGYNVDNNDLIPNQSYAEATDDRLDQLSNGFKLRSTFATSNASGGTYIFMALAENPFGGANTAPANAR